METEDSTSRGVNWSNLSVEHLKIRSITLINELPFDQEQYFQTGITSGLKQKFACKDVQPNIVIE